MYNLDSHQVMVYGHYILSWFGFLRSSIYDFRNFISDDSNLLYYIFHYAIQKPKIDTKRYIPTTYNTQYETTLSIQSLSFVTMQFSDNSL